MAVTFTSELDFNVAVLEYLQFRLTEQNLPEKVIGGYDSDSSDNYILRDFSFSKDGKGDWRLFGGCQEIDVVIYEDIVSKMQFMGPRFATTGTGLRGDIIIPKVIIELKKASTRTPGGQSNFPSHDAIASNQIAMDIKRLYPGVMALFVFDHFEGIKKPEENISFQRMLYAFDDIILNWDAEKKEVWKKLNFHLRR